MRAGVLLLAAAVALCDAGPVDMSNVPHHVLPDYPPDYHPPPYDYPHHGLCRMMMTKIHEFLEYHGLKDWVDAEEYEMDCDEHGNFEPKQCYDVTEDETWCACVDPITGKVRPNTMTKDDGLLCDENGKISKPCCDPHWTQHSEHGHDMCYIFIDTPMTWVDAENYCMFEEGHLASIHCQETNHFLQALTRGEKHTFPLSWVGGDNAVQSCFWSWSDGSRFKFEDWHQEESKFRENSCLRINFGCNVDQYKWTSGCCNDTLPFVCAKEVS